MTIRVAINGYGRIGRMVLRALYEEALLNNKKRDIKIVAINAMGDIDINAHLINVNLSFMASLTIIMMIIQKKYFLIQIVVGHY